MNTKLALIACLFLFAFAYATEDDNSKLDNDNKGGHGPGYYDIAEKDVHKLDPYEIADKDAYNELGEIDESYDMDKGFDSEFENGLTEKSTQALWGRRRRRRRRRRAPAPAPKPRRPIIFHFYRRRQIFVYGKKR
ncbi:hypothetical protein TrispH2_007441 [Trichoplax sp. H2]|nr:hypothetical protein TrispH2_007441 [Trichoplax sp. H2]|eukprot:RDD40581.1 hypothetical protein TrispH2_007441 [Trichoplax sp. H2]